MEYAYDPAGNRVYKQETVGSTVNKTWYVRDAQGNVLGVYGNKNGDALTYWKEQHLYGSSRLGMWLPDINIVGGTSSTPWNSPGNRRYELANHLGNVLSTISDAAKVNFFPVVESAQDYYPFGMMQPGRTYDRVAGSGYRYGFNGKENDNEIKGEGNQQDYGFRIYDPRLGKFLSVDPLTSDYPFYTPYQFAGNKPIMAIDLDGAEELPMIKKFDPYTDPFPIIAAIDNGGINALNSVIGLWNGAVQTVRSLNKGTYVKDLGKELKGFGNQIKQEYDYRITTPFVQQVKELVAIWQVISLWKTCPLCILGGNLHQPRQRVVNYQHSA